MSKISLTVHKGAFSLPKQSMDSSQRLVWAMKTFQEAGSVLYNSSLQASVEELSMIHAPSYVKGIKQLSENVTINDYLQLDPELVLNNFSWLAASSAAATLAEIALQAMRTNQPTVDFALSRPGSHHAGYDYGLGLCIFNNIAYATKQVQANELADRIAILDFDAHHGNGTEEIFSASSNVLTVSMHQFPFFPGSGQSGSSGALSNLNIILQKGDGHQAGCRAIEQALNAIEHFQPQLLLIEAGVDGHQDDWTSELEYQEETFIYFADRISDLQQALVIPIVAEVGGGYTQTAVQKGFSALLKGLGK